MELVHGTCIAIDDFALLLRGPAGAGKSDMALRLLDHGAALVADDQVVAEVEDGALWASAPAPLRGLLEVRGVGIVRWPALERARLGAIVDLTEHERIERLPEPQAAALLGIDLPLFQIDPRAPSAAAKVRLLVRTCRQDILATSWNP